MARQKRTPCPETDALGEKLGKTVQRLRTAGNLSLGDLSEMSGVAKSMISQIEKNESNPTIGTLSRLGQALGISVETFLSGPNGQQNLVQHASVQDIPVIKSEDGLCELKIVGWIETVQWVQWYEFKASCGGVLESSPHPCGSIENLSVLSGEARVTVGDQSWTVKQGETLRYRADLEHKIENVSDVLLQATMVNILATALKG
ncbi:MAG: helix-turn-helix transcriptional regulator [Hellea sp.]|nr:helix-turn-helix transcriptional regulator [Hellea sp.]